MEGQHEFLGGKRKKKKKDGDDESEVQWLHSYIEIKKETEMN
jgi:hypothetical protein